MSFKRFVYEKLLAWKESENRKPLIVRGARQVGKTTIIKDFSKNFKKSILLNLEKPADIRYFQDFDNVLDIKDALFFEYNITTKDTSETLLFIDEIQESTKAIQLLRYFYEEIPNLYVIAAGSLLEFAIKDVKSFPVGRVEYLHMHPLNFGEFLMALDKENMFNALRHIPIPNYAHQTLLELFNTFVIIGGMPEVVSLYRKTNSISDLPKIYESIWATYKNDVEKYTTNTTAQNIIKHIVNVAHLYIDQRIKFQNFGNSNYRSREVSEAFKNLDNAKIIQLIYPTTDVSIPIKPNLKKSPRLQFLDTGLVNYDLKIQANMLTMNDLSHQFKGAIIPHIILQELLSLNTINNHKPHFWVREKPQASSEVDLVYPYKNKVIPIEIKSGAAGKLKSLHEFIERTNHNYAVRIYAGKFSVEKHKTPNKNKPYKLMNLPYYLGIVLEKYIAYFVENY